MAVGALAEYQTEQQRRLCEGDTVGIPLPNDPSDKTCLICKEAKSREAFRLDVLYWDGRGAACVECNPRGVDDFDLQLAFHREEGRRKIAIHRAQTKAKKHREELRRARIYGQRDVAFNTLLAAQGGRCGICGDELRDGKMLTGRGAHLDHDHRTGEYRGVLCQGCNVAIGHLRDDPERMRLAARYIEAQARRPLEAADD